jgi:hypothetical protein
LVIVSFTKAEMPTEVLGLRNKVGVASGRKQEVLGVAAMIKRWANHRPMKAARRADTF